MAEMVGLSQGLRRRNGAIATLVAALKSGLSRLSGRGRASQLALEQWPDYLLRDIGLDRTVRDQGDPRATSTDWLSR
jgi:uncharacterized protein YjiS (DUF1127 family)